MSSLRATLNDLAEQFTSGVLAAIRTASLEELQAEAGGRPHARDGGRQPDPLRRSSGRLARRSIEQIDATLAKVVAAVTAKKGGMRAEEIRKALRLDVREIPRVLKQGLRTKKLKAKGQKRATTYSAA
jgi:hypothetical protein